MSSTPAAKSAMAALIQEKYLADRVFPAAAAAVAALRRDDFRVVLVTGSLDFIVRPLADALGVDDVIANVLEEDVNTQTFTGRLEGVAVADEEKRVRVLEYAAENDVDLSASHAYGDSIADLPMLECVGVAHAVSPSDALRARAEEERWPVLTWKEDYLNEKKGKRNGNGNDENGGGENGGSSSSSTSSSSPALA